MSTDKINRAILLAMVMIGAVAYGLLYSHASIVFKLLVPLALIVLVVLIVRDVIKDQDSGKR
jgi:membrane protein implicated in regulation of membrane protease activity